MSITCRLATHRCTFGSSKPGWHSATHLADSLANDVQERVKDLDGGAEAVYQFPIVMAIFLEAPFLVHGGVGGPPRENLNVRER